MRLTKLEMYGFKSFARKTEIEFQNGITAIIGPNGSGKSNIADAVRWVLGEQSARNLRGEKMEDVIFSGTEQKRPMDYSEVSLYFDNSDGELLTEFAEVCITRRMYRTGESEYMLNRAKVRRKDVMELFRDTGVGKEGYSIIGQGRVDEILSNKSADRRNAFEEAAGVMKYRVRKEEAERKLENTASNLERLKDILSELERQVGPLEEQSEGAREFLRLRDELREIEINVFLYQYDKLNERIKANDEVMRSLGAEISTSEALDASLASLCAGEEERERALNQSISEVQNKLLSLSSGVEARSGESKLYAERIANLIKERERNAELAGEKQSLCEALSADKAERAAALEGMGESLAARRAEAEAASSAISDMNADIEGREETLEKQKSDMIAAMNRVADARIQLSRYETMRQNLISRSEAVELGMKGLEAKKEKLDGEYAAAAQAHEAMTLRRNSLLSARDGAIARLNETNERLRASREETRDKEQKAEACRARLKVLEEMKRAHEGYYASIRSILSDSERNMELRRSIEGVVAELLRVPGEYETAIEMALGPALQNIVTPTEEDAKRVIEHLRAKNYGRATLLPVSAIRPRTLDERERALCAGRGFIGVASELVSFDGRYRGIFENLLGRTVIVSDLDSGIAISKKARAAFRIATLKGDIINPGGSMTGGSTQKREFSIVGREREIEELKERTVALDRRREECRALCAGLEEALSSMNAEVAERSEAYQAQLVEYAAHAEKVDIIKKYVDAAADEIADALEEQERIRDDVASIDEQCRAAEADREGMEHGNTVTQDEIKRAQEELYALRRGFSEANGRATELRVAVAALEKEYAAAKNDLERIARDADSARAEAERLRKAVEDSASLFGDLQKRMDSIEGDISAERQEVDAVTARLHAMEEERKSHLASLDDMRARREENASALREARDRLHRAELNVGRSEVELKAMQDRIWADYELTYENALPLRRQIAITASHLKVDELKSAIRALGDVNINAIEDYKNVKARFDEMSAQYDDLTKAEADLRDLISELVSTMEREFRRQFERIQENFTAVFAELFGGGRAELVLSDRSDILNCNIDIIAQPPGKRLQLLSLLSGGERALTAIALLFAILKLKPTAFCILDEIETSLDEVNVSTVAGYVKHYSDKTQFIMITHRKGSMEVCNSLYGVAMEEKGVSKIVSARFDG